MTTDTELTSHEIQSPWRAGPSGIPIPVPGSRFILDPDPDPGKLFSKLGSGSKPGFALFHVFHVKPSSSPPKIMLKDILVINPGQDPGPDPGQGPGAGQDPGSSPWSRSRSTFQVKIQVQVQVKNQVQVQGPYNLGIFFLPNPDRCDHHFMDGCVYSTLLQPTYSVGTTLPGPFFSSRV